ncbi:hypothetical protein K503DRAFT_787432 [Rhizopogon vinicolor AM-OR11-026]|uniref:Uncharacterized protein n=1 Tax=Rhizopogon vinicolor AM-OR11-026 TaxID=1314800 RepID=A0A1B7MHL9_9AGAM|nr:hypothetical protein K503DRAFT_787432 [Rhizopogon vinicolor AM-OR11-026]
MVISAYCSALTSAQRLANSSREFVSVCVTQLGIESLITSSATFCIDDKAFEDAIREYQLEEQDNVEASESGGSWTGTKRRIDCWELPVVALPPTTVYYSRPQPTTAYYGSAW